MKLKETREEKTVGINPEILTACASSRFGNYAQYIVKNNDRYVEVIIRNSKQYIGEKRVIKNYSASVKVYKSKFDDWEYISSKMDLLIEKFMIEVFCK